MAFRPLSTGRVAGPMSRADRQEGGSQVGRRCRVRPPARSLGFAIAGCYVLVISAIITLSPYGIYCVRDISPTAVPSRFRKYRRPQSPHIEPSTIWVAIAVPQTDPAQPLNLAGLFTA